MVYGKSVMIVIVIFLNEVFNYTLRIMNGNANNENFLVSAKG